jgi:hypothetical protein
MHAYIVKTPDGYLYPFAGDLSLTDDETQAGHFMSTDEARETAEVRGYYDGGFEILRVDVDERRLNRQRQDDSSGGTPDRLDRKQAENSIPADPDPDDPASR